MQAEDTAHQLGTVTLSERTSIRVGINNSCIVEISIADSE